MFFDIKVLLKMRFGNKNLHQIFFKAVIKNDCEKIRLLLLNVDIETPIGNTTALIYAVRNNQLDMTKTLLMGGANPNISDSNDTNALRWACYNKNYKIVKLLLATGANPNLTSKKDGKTALHIAVKKNDIKIIKILLLNGAHVDIKDKAGNTAVDFACKWPVTRNIVKTLQKAQLKQQQKAISFRKYSKIKKRRIR